MDSKYIEYRWEFSIRMKYSTKTDIQYIFTLISGKTFTLHSFIWYKVEKPWSFIQNPIEKRFGYKFEKFGYFQHPLPFTCRLKKGRFKITRSICNFSRSNWIPILPILCERTVPFSNYTYFVTESHTEKYFSMSIYQKKKKKK
uniref:Uncharacterized protein n=2 Tax=Cacopsylla melanoneura TaxID=428564 RepID=A0A8D9ECI0_9HEMI